MSTYDLKRLLKIFIELAYRENADNFQITVEVDEILFEDCFVPEF